MLLFFYFCSFLISCFLISIFPQYFLFLSFSFFFFLFLSFFLQPYFFFTMQNSDGEYDSLNDSRSNADNDNYGLKSSLGEVSTGTYCSTCASLITKNCSLTTDPTHLLFLYFFMNIIYSFLCLSFNLIDISGFFKSFCKRSLTS